MTAAELIERARSCVGLDAGYALGGGKLSAVGKDPLDENGNCDCSAFVCWCLGLGKVSDFAWLKKINGGWYNTDGIWWDAAAEGTGHFSGALSSAGEVAGSVVVYPRLSTLILSHQYSDGELPPRASYPRVGHVGIVTRVNPLRIVHCSAGNERKYGAGHAIQETDGAVFERWHGKGTIYTWCELVDREQP